MKGLFTWIGFPAGRRAIPPRSALRRRYEMELLAAVEISPSTASHRFSIAAAEGGDLHRAVDRGVRVLLRSLDHRKTIIWGDPVAGFPTLIVVVLFLGGMQLTFLGVIGEYLGRMFDETKRRPLYFLKGLDLPTDLYRQPLWPIRAGPASVADASVVS